MRAIDADAVKRSIWREWLCSRTIKEKELCDILEKIIVRCCEHIDAAPTIDAEPVRHGHWIENHYVFYVFGENYQPALNVEIDYKCSICNEDNEKTTDYCPCCGAKMDEVSE